MKLLCFLLMLVCALMADRGDSAPTTDKPGPVYNQNIYNYGSKELLFYIKALLKELKNNRGQGVLTHNCVKIVPKNCAEVLKCGGTQTGVYFVDPADGKGSFKVFCDQKSNGGGWAVVQRRQDGSVDFYRGWNDYKNGFGNLKGEFWLGLDKIYRLTHQTRNRLRVELGDWKGKRAYAEYDYFAVASERNKYKLSHGRYSGTAGDSLRYHNGMPFSTKDRDNDPYGGGNCAAMRKGAWWYKSCNNSNLNGRYFKGGKASNSDGVNWGHWRSYSYSLKRAEIKIRPI